MQLKETFERVKRASKSLALLSDGQRNEILNAPDGRILHQFSDDEFHREL